MAISESEVDFASKLEERRGRPRAVSAHDAAIMREKPGKWFTVATKASKRSLSSRVGQLRRKLPNTYGGAWEVCTLDGKLAARFVAEIHPTKDGAA